MQTQASLALGHGLHGLCGLEPGVSPRPQPPLWRRSWACPKVQVVVATAPSDEWEAQATAEGPLHTHSPRLPGPGWVACAHSGPAGSGNKNHFVAWTEKRVDTGKEGEVPAKICVHAYCVPQPWSHPFLQELGARWGDKQDPQEQEWAWSGCGPEEGLMQAGVIWGREGTGQCVLQPPTPSLVPTEEWPDFSGPQPSLQNVGGVRGSHLSAAPSPCSGGRPHDQVLPIRDPVVCQGRMCDSSWASKSSPWGVC